MTDTDFTDEPTFTLTAMTKVVEGVTLTQVQALIDIPARGVVAGDLGGWVDAAAQPIPATTAVTPTLSGTAWLDQASALIRSTLRDSTITDSVIVGGRVNASTLTGVQSEDSTFDHATVESSTIHDSSIFDSTVSASELTAVSVHSSIAQRCILVGGTVWSSVLSNVRAPALHSFDQAVIESDHDWQQFGPFGPNGDRATVYRFNADPSVVMVCVDQWVGPLDQFPAHLAELTDTWPDDGNRRQWLEEAHGIVSDIKLFSSKVFGA